MARVNIIAKLIAYIESKTTIPVYVSIPNPEPEESTPDEFYVIELTGEKVDEYTDHAEADVAVQSYSQSILSAHTNSIAIRDILLNAAENISEVAHVSSDSMYNWSLDKFKRYQQVAHITYKLEENS